MLQETQRKIPAPARILIDCDGQRAALMCLVFVGGYPDRGINHQYFAIRRALPFKHHRDVEFVVIDREPVVSRTAIHRRHLDIGMHLGKRSECPRHHCIAILLGDTQPHLALEWRCGERSRCLVDQCNNTPRIIEKLVAFGCELDTTRTALEQRRADTLLKLFYLHADSRLGAVNQIGGTRHIARFGHRQKST